MSFAIFTTLPGSDAYPEFITVVNPVGLGVTVDTQPTTWNRLGWCPVISTITGIARALLGIVHMIAHLACALFSASSAYHFTQARLAVSNVFRGVGEALPLIGNLAFFVKDMITGIDESKKGLEYLESHPEDRGNVVLLVSGEAKAVNTREEFINQLLTAGFSPDKPPTLWDHFTLLRA
ncbi:hypothetical protein [Estrella lausannensis]|uniref:Uncharacterized protein n=1 Tax=Estrella lausannensis TaxID=483423 RepID=A0A0H5DR85_9BACT|nr:hypothetical protein [Estrella lausannensis]CRX38683.1 hypothetical protein ELAC_1344 [Estrella lausannensis]